MGPMRMGYTPNKRPIGKETTRRVMSTFGPYKLQLTVVFAAVLVSVTLGLLTPFYLKIIINDGILKGRLDIVQRYTILTLLATIGGTVFSLAYSYQSIDIGQRIMRDLRNDLYSHLQAMSLRFFTGTRTGEIQSRLANDVGGIQSVVSDTAANILNNVSTVLSTLVAMIYMDWRLTLLSIGILPLFAVLSMKVGVFARGIRQKSQSQLADLNSTMQETLSVSGILLTKISGRQQLSMQRFQKENQALTATQIQQAMIMRYFFNLIGLTFSITPVLVYWLAGYLVIHNHDKGLSIGVIVAFTALQSRLFFPLTNLLNIQVDVSSSFALFDRIFEYLDMPQEIADGPNSKVMNPEDVKGEVTFTHVNFRYEEGQEELTLSEVSFDAKPGELIALVGASGAGKTTLTYMIPRLYDVETGSVSIDGQDVRNIKLESLGKIIGVVTQETYLVHDTIRTNLLYGRPDATEEDLIAAATAAAIHEHIASLPDGYDTVVGERGYKLSGGEKQRIAIARAILKNPRILILDEATSSLDTTSERLIQAALEPLMKGRTTFAIAHRLSTILSADQILVMDNGEIVERGTHDELLAKDGFYRKLYEAQFVSSDGTITAHSDEYKV